MNGKNYSSNEPFWPLIINADEYSKFHLLKPMDGWVLCKSLKEQILHNDLISYLY